MATLVFIDGFERQIAAAVATSIFTNKQRSATATNSPGTRSFQTGRTGGICQRFSATAAGNHSVWDEYALPSGATRYGVMSFYFRKTATATPNSPEVIAYMESGTSVFAEIGHNTGGTLAIRVNGGSWVNHATSIADNTWYRIEFWFDAGATTYTTKMRLFLASTEAESGSEVQATATGMTTSTVAVFGVELDDDGTNTASSYSADFDDWVVSSTTGDYPVGEHKVVSLAPNADGTHNPSTPDCFQDAAAASIVVSTNPAWDNVNTIPWNTTTWLQQTSSTSPHNGHYLEIAFADTTETNILGVIGEGLCLAATTTSDNATLSCYDGTNTTTIHTGDWSETTGQQVAKILTIPSGGWNTSLVNGVVARFGLSSDASPVPKLAKVLLEVAVGPAAGTTPVNQTLAPSYTVKNSVAKTLSESYTVRGTVSKTEAPSYAITTLVAKTLAPSYAIGGSPMQSAAISYVVKNTLADSLGLTYTLKAKVNKTTTASYTIATIATTPVSKSFSTSYSVLAVGVRGLLSLLVSPAYYTAVQKFVNPNYTVRNAISKSVAVSYTIKALVVKTSVPAYTVRNRVAKNFASIYTIKNLLADSFAEAYTVRNVVIKTTAYSYSIASMGSYNTIYNVYGTVMSTPTSGVIDAYCRQLVRGANEFLYIFAIDDYGHQVSGNDFIFALRGSGSGIPSTFIHRDTANRPVTPAHLDAYAGPDCRIDSSGIVHILYQWWRASDNRQQLLYAQFNTNTDTWVLKDEVVVTSGLAFINHSWKRSFMAACLSLDASGVPQVVYGTAAGATVWIERTAPGTWTNHGNISTGELAPVHFQSVIDPFGIHHVVWVQDSTNVTHSVIRYARRSGTTWVAETVGSATATPDPLTVTGFDQVPSVVWLQTANKPVVMYLDAAASNMQWKRRDGAGTWTTLTAGADTHAGTGYTNGNRLYGFEGHQIPTSGNLHPAYQVSTNAGTSWSAETVFVPSATQDQDGSASVRYDPLYDNRPQYIDWLAWDERSPDTDSNHLGQIYYVCVQPAAFYIGDSQAFNYQITIHVGTTVSPTYNIRNRVSKTVAPSYTTKVTVGKSLTVNYTLRGRALKTGIFTYSIQAGATVVQQLTPITYLIRAQLNKTLTPTYFTKRAIPTNRPETYIVKNLVTKSQVFSYTLRSRVIKLLAPTYGIRNRIPNNFTVNYTLGNRVAKTVSPTYFVKAPVGKSFSVGYNIAGSHLQKNQAFTYFVRKQVPVSSMAVSYKMINAVNKTLTPSYHLFDQFAVKVQLTPTYKMGYVRQSLTFTPYVFDERALKVTYQIDYVIRSPIIGNRLALIRKVVITGSIYRVEIQ